MSEWPPPISPWRRGLHKIAASPWSLALLALGELVLGFILLSFPYLLGTSVTWVAGFVFCIAAVFSLVQIRHTKRVLWGIYSALAYFVVGGLMLTQPVMALTLWTLVLAILLLVVGVMRLVIAYGMRGSQGSAWRFFSALVALALGGLVTFSWPASSQWFLGTVIAVEMVFSGWTMLFLVISSDLATNQ